MHASEGTSVRLVVFADDWGGHPSSCQHLVRHLMGRYPVVWVNTIGTRRPGVSRRDLSRAASRLRAWSTQGPASRGRSENPMVISPPMWPGFRARWQRRLNAHLVTRAVNRALGPRRGDRRIAITTIPITAELIGRVDVDHWVYYCVDDFSAWPGLDGTALRALDEMQLRQADQLVVASQVLGDRAARLGRAATLLTHGVEVDAWQVTRSPTLPTWWAGLEPPIWLFWGLIDQRLDVSWCRALASGAAGPGTLVLVGPHAQGAPSIPGSFAPGAVSFRELPSLAAAADVLVMPYADVPVTQAMQPLKLKEYLVTNRPVVVRDLPATREWADAADVVCSLSDFVQAVRARSHCGTPEGHLRARARLRSETWAAKASAFERVLVRGGNGHA